MAGYNTATRVCLYHPATRGCLYHPATPPRLARVQFLWTRRPGNDPLFSLAARSRPFGILLQKQSHNSYAYLVRRLQTGFVALYLTFFFPGLEQGKKMSDKVRQTQSEAFGLMHAYFLIKDI